MLVRLLTTVAALVLLSAPPLVPAAPPRAPIGTAALPHAPILIVGDANLTAVHGVTGGSGTATDPYVISNWSIATPGAPYPPTYPYAAVQLNDTTAYVVLRDLALVSSAPSGAPNVTVGIRLSNTIHVTVANVTTTQMVVGIELDGGTDLRVTQVVSTPPTVWTGTRPFGMAVYASTQVTVDGVSLRGQFSEGVHVFGGSHMLLEQLHTNDTTGSAVSVWVASNVTVESSVFNFANDGVSSYNATDLVVADNTIDASFPFFIQFGTRTTVIGNTIPQVVQAPFYLWNTTDFTAYHNDFLSAPIRPMQGNDSQRIALDDGYPGGGNFWADYQGADNCHGSLQDNCSNRDGIGDVPYQVPLVFPSISTPLVGTYTDHYPMIRPWPLPVAAPHAVLVAAPTVLNPGGRLRLDGANSTDARDPLSLLQFRFQGKFGAAFVFDTGWTNQSSYSAILPSIGTFTIRLLIRNTAGLTNESTAQVEVSPAVAATPTVYLVLAVGAAAVVVVSVVVLLRRRGGPDKGSPPANESTPMHDQEDGPPGPPPAS